MKVRSMKTVAEAIFESTKGKTGTELSHALTNSSIFLKDNQLLGKSKEILAHLEKIIDADEKIIRAKITSSSVLPKKMLEELEDNLQKRYKAKKVEVDQVEDKSILSGIKVEVGDEIIDLTLAHRLKQLQAHLINN